MEDQQGVGGIRAREAVGEDTVENVLGSLHAGGSFDDRCV